MFRAWITVQVKKIRNMLVALARRVMRSFVDFQQPPELKYTMNLEMTGAAKVSMIAL